MKGINGADPHSLESINQSVYYTQGSTTELSKKNKYKMKTT